MNLMEINFMKKICAILIFALGVPASGLNAQTVRVAGHRYPRQMEAKDLTWTLSGAEHFRFRLFSVFTGALFQNEDTGGKKLTFTYTRNLGRDVLVDQGQRVLREANDRETLRKFNANLEKINAAFQDVRDGDQYTITVIPERGTWLHFNDEEKFYVDDYEFGMWYLGIWLGDKPMSTGFRDALLNGGNL